MGALGITVPEFEVNHIFVEHAAAGAQISAIYIKAPCFQFTVPILRPGDYLYFLYTSAATDGHQPDVTIWLREELALTRLYGGG